ncbi:efflux RND transporter permease subunit [Candidatus Poribacteria bacterium]
MKLSDLSIKRAVTFSMIFIAVACFGVVSLLRLSPELLPDITFPVASVITNYAGVGPEDMEKLIARPMEESVSIITGVKEVISTCKEGAVITTVRFDWGTDMDAAVADMREGLDMIGDFFPEDASEPIIFKFDVSMQPVMFVGLSSETLDTAAIKKLSEDEIEPIIERVEGVAFVGTMGGEDREIQVQVDRSKMEASNLSIHQIVNILRGENITMQAGEVDVDKFTHLLRTVGEFTSIDQISNVVVAYQNGAPVYVRDIAEVHDTTAERKEVVHIDGNAGVAFYVQKQSDANTVEVVKKVKQTLEELRLTLEGRAKLTVIMDLSRFINRSLSNLSSVAIWGGILAVLVLFFFLHNVRSVLIIALAIPMSVIATFISMDAAGITLNMMSMGGLALGIGLLVDNAIVVLESVFRHREEGKDRRTAASVGTNEVSRAIIASTLTTISVFFPIVFVPGIAGVLFKDQALTVTFALACSLLVALTLVPLLCSRFLRLESERRRATWTSRLSSSFGSRMNRLDGSYQAVLNWALDHRKTVILTVLAMFLISIAMIAPPLRLVGIDFIPAMDQGELILNLESAPGTSLEVTEEAISKIEQIVMEETEAELDALYTTVGSGEGIAALFSGEGRHSGSVTLELVDIGKRERSQKEIENVLRAKAVDVPGLEMKTGVDPGAEMMGFGGAPVTVEIYGHDPNTARQLANRVKAIVENVKGTTNVQTSIVEPSPETQIIIDRDRAYALGLNVASIASAVQANVYGTVATRYREGGDEYDVLVRLKEEDRKTHEDVYNTYITSPMGKQIPLRNVASLQVADGPVTINRKKQERLVTVTADLKGRDLGGVTRDVQAGLKSLVVPPGFIVSISGSAQDMNESFRWLVLALVGAIFLVYAVMASLFESLLDPFIIMFTFPLAIIGVVWLFFLTGTVFSIIAFIGVIMLAGIVVNNAIVMVDYINQLRERGMELREAVVQGGRTRVRPILMTALTTILAMVPLALGFGAGAEIRYPMARAVVGGLAASTILTLVLVPVLYTIFENFADRRRKLRAEKRARRWANE